MEKSYYEKHKTEMLKQQKSYREANREEILRRDREYHKAKYNENKDKIIARVKAYRAVNKEKINKTNRMNRLNYCVDNRWDEVEGYAEMLKSGATLFNMKDSKGRNWVLHHRLEERGLSVKELKESGRYFGCQPSELVFMLNSEHARLHRTLGNKSRF